MSFMKEILKQNTKIWDECAKTPFIKELSSGRLPMEKFRNYMIQDSIYLKNYARIYGKAIYLSDRLKDIQVFYSILNFVTDTESAVRLSYLKQFGMNDDDVESALPLDENKRYIDFMEDIAGKDSIPAILMVAMPCMLSYSYVFRKIAPYSVHSPYYDFIADNSDDTYAHNCRIWWEFTEKKCADLSESSRHELASIFQGASLLELDFWKMAYREVVS